MLASLFIKFLNKSNFFYYRFIQRVHIFKNFIPYKKFGNLLGKTLTINPLRRSNLTPLHRNYLQLKIPNVTSV